MTSPFTSASTSYIRPSSGGNKRDSELLEQGDLGNGVSHFTASQAQEDTYELETDTKRQHRASTTQLKEITHRVTGYTSYYGGFCSQGRQCLLIGQLFVFQQAQRAF